MSSFDQVIKNILADIFGEEEQQEVTRPRARPEGLMSSTRPQARPEDVEPVQPSASESTSKFVAAMGDYDDTTEQGVEIPLAFFKGTARDLEGRYKTTGMQLAKLNRGTEGSTVKVSSVEEDTTVDDLLSEVQAAISKPSYQRAAGRGFKMSVSDIQTHLKARGYDTGDIDGRMGPKTRAAIKSFQRDNDLVADGIVGKNTQTALQGVEPLTAITTQELEPAPMNLSGVKTERERIQEILERDDFVEVEPGFELGTPSITVSSNTKKTKEEKEDVQRALLELGYDVGEVDGVIGTKTRAAIRQFQKDNNLSADAVVGKNTAAAMNEAMSKIKSVPVNEETDTPKIIEAGMLPPLSSWQKVFSIFTDPETQARTLMSAAPLASKVLPVNASTFAEFLGNEGKIDLTSDDLSGTDYLYLRNKALEVIERGDDKFTYNDWGLEDGKSALMADLTKTAWSSLTDPAFRMATLIGQTAPGNVRIEDGRIIVEDVYDFNSGPRGRKLQKAFELKDQGNTEEYEKLSAEALEGMTHLGQLRVWAAALGVPQGEGTRFKLDLGAAP